MDIKTVKISSKRQITIPKSFAALKEGHKAILVGDGDQLIIKPLPTNVSEAALLSEAALAEQWNSKEDEEAFRYLQ
jgi:bifunctional DNA-binding transcriptional regulator/antitoxin component of YhaV-PrlF toxin-antitoxin module